eukprot:4487207-Amphidinium_carterae.1
MHGSFGWCEPLHTATKSVQTSGCGNAGGKGLLHYMVDSRDADSPPSAGHVPFNYGVSELCGKRQAQSAQCDMTRHRACGDGWN